MRRFLPFLLINGLFLYSPAQSQMSSASRQALLLSSKSSVALVAKVNADFDASHWHNTGVKIGARIGTIVTLRVSKNALHLLEHATGFDYLEVAQPVVPNLKRVALDVRADSVYAGHGLVSSYTGKNVIIGVTDWGFDYTHPMFYDTALQRSRILAAWDQFKKSGPAPKGYNYGTEYVGQEKLLAAQSDTSNIYGNAYHGSHVAGIAGGGGGGTDHRGLAYEAEFLFVTFLVDEAAVIDAFHWMKTKADAVQKRLVINMSWGLYNLGPLDGTSLVSQAIDELSSQGVIFVTSGGNNGDAPFHLKHTFDEDTVRTKIDFWRGSNPYRYGQSISAWGEVKKPFSASIQVYDAMQNKLAETPIYQSLGSLYIDTFLTVGNDTVFYKVALDGKHPLNDKPTIRLRVRNENVNLHVALKAHADSGTVHFYNVADLTTDVGNWGMPFVAWKKGWQEGDNSYSLGEPASTRSVITVAAHQSEIRINGEIRGGGFKANFSSLGPTIDERAKPDVSAPGVGVMSSVSSFTDANLAIDQSVVFEGKNYPFSRLSGTSMSSPATAGVVALMLQANPQLWYDEAKEILHATARQDIHTGDLADGGDMQWGWGKVNALAAVARSEKKYVVVKDVETANRTFVVFPNPAKNVVYVAADKEYKVSVYTIDGKELLVGSVGASSCLDISKLHAGLYVLRFEKSEFGSLRFMKQ